MRYPKHLVLDFENRKNIETNWSYRFNLSNKKSLVFFFIPLNLFKNSTFLKTGTPMIDKQEKYTLCFRQNSTFKFKPEVRRTTPINLDILPSKDITTKKGLIDFLGRSTKKENHKMICYRNLYSKIYFSLYKTLKLATINSNADPLRSLTNVNFLRRERLYTKLKYSRSPAYDIVSGGAAALLAGFLGFLVSEKYGFELVDSGDFYYLFMYAVFLGFSLRPLLTSINCEKSILSILSPKLFLEFYLTLIYILIRKKK